MSLDRQISDEFQPAALLERRGDPASITLRWAARADVLTLLKLKFLVSRHPSAADELKEITDVEWVRGALSELLNEAGPFAFPNYAIAVAGGAVLGAVCLNWFDRARRKHLMSHGPAPIEDQLLRLAPHSLLISDMAVFGPYRRDGIATRLLSFAEEKARGFSTRRMALMVDSDNAPALDLYMKFGFKRRAARPKPIDAGSGQAASSVKLILMTKTLSSDDA